MKRGFKNCLNLSDVIHGRPLYLFNVILSPKYMKCDKGLSESAALHFVTRHLRRKDDDISIFFFKFKKYCSTPQNHGHIRSNSRKSKTMKVKKKVGSQQKTIMLI